MPSACDDTEILKPDMGLFASAIQAATPPGPAAVALAASGRLAADFCSRRRRLSLRDRKAEVESQNRSQTFELARWGLELERLHHAAPPATIAAKITRAASNSVMFG